MIHRTVREHDHQYRHRETRSAPDLGGKTVIEDCVAADCDGWRARWVPVPEQMQLPIATDGGADDA